MLPARNEFLARKEFAHNIHTFVVDNGKSTHIANTEHVKLNINQNLGGSGGFTRGLMEAQENDYTHCLFMDDDASIHMENISQTYRFLMFTKNHRTAVAGAMISNTNKWQMWESGAYFDRFCHPLFHALNLTHWEHVFRIESESALPKPKGFYGYWWFFAFPIQQAKHFPFPFFVRGDDINFCIANDFDIETLNGVVFFQEYSKEKEFPLTL